MKRIIYILLIVGIFLSSCAFGNAKKWSLGDFNIYNSSGEVIDRPHPPYSGGVYYEHISLGSTHCDDCREDHRQGQTRKGVAIGDNAVEALSKYDLSGAYIRTGDYQSGIEWHELETLEKTVSENTTFFIFVWLDDNFNSVGRPTTDTSWKYVVSFLIRDNEIESYDGEIRGE